MHPLISVADLRGLLERPDADLVVLDVRWKLGGPPGRQLYDGGHVPGAAYVDLDLDLARPADEHGRHPLPTSGEFAQAMRRAGVRKGSQVVCYDADDSTSAARLWWLLGYYGHPSVQVLDGGYAGWVAAGAAVSTLAPPPADTDFEAVGGHRDLLDADAAAAVSRAGVLLDARSAERYAGEQEPVDAVAGHIPGATSSPTTGNVGADGRFLRPDALSGRFERLGVTDGRPVAAYCGSGITAAHQVLALELAGVSAALYADSWSGWITDSTRPVATGPDRG